MKILDIRETAVPIKSNIRNAYIDFSQMTVSALALVTDVVRDGKRVAGFGFNSNGRYAPSGLLRDRFIPRLKSTKPESIVDDTGDAYARALAPYKLRWFEEAGDPLGYALQAKLSEVYEP